MRLFALAGALLIAAGAFLLVDGGFWVSRAVRSELLSVRVWETEFWFARIGNVSAGLSPNAHWFLRICGGIVATAVGSKILKVATR